LPPVSAVDVETKLLPVTVMVVGVAVPARTDPGATAIAPGAGFKGLTAKAEDAELPPPGDGLTAVSARLPAAVRSAADGTTLTSVGLV